MSRGSRRRTLAGLSAALLGVASGVPAAWAHGGAGDQTGMGHVLSSAEHVAMFVAVGAAAAVITLIRRLAAVVAANAVLVGVWFSTGASHAVDQGR